MSYNPALIRAQSFVQMYENYLDEMPDNADLQYCLGMAQRFQALVEPEITDPDAATAFLDELLSRTGLGAGWLDMRLGAAYWLKRLTKNRHVKILEDHEWYDGYLSGMCEYNGQTHYFHWVSGGYWQENYLPRVYRVYELQTNPNVQSFDELKDQRQVGSFDEDEISPDSECCLDSCCKPKEEAGKIPSKPWCSQAQQSNTPSSSITRAG